MCTLTYLPKENDDYIFTSNRDEYIHRQDALPPQMYEIDKKNFFCPIDTQGQGTWIGVNEAQTFVCLLNGAFEAHIRQEKYRKSRGLIVKEILLYKPYTANEKLHDFLRNYDFSDIEPFTLVVKELGNLLFEFRWTGTQYFFKYLDSRLPYIWSSATLYNKEAREIRKKWFEEWLLQPENKEYTKENILKLHFDNTKGDIFTNFNVNIRKYQVKTVSITNIEKTKENFDIQYFDLKNEKTHLQTFNF